MLQAEQQKNRGLIAGRCKRFLSSPQPTYGLWVHPASYVMDTSGTVPGVKWPEREADHSLCLVSNLRMVKVKQPLYRPITGPEGSRRLRIPGVETFGTCRWKVYKPYPPAAFTPQEIFLVLISVRG